MQKLKDNWVILAAVTVVVTLVVVYVVNHTKYTPTGTAGELQAKVDFKA